MTIHYNCEVLQYGAIKMGKRTVSITLSKDVVNQIDDCANFMGMNRSAFMEWVFKSVLPTIPEVTSKLKQNFKQRVKEFWEWLEPRKDGDCEVNG